jgi:hypothetical protein
LNTKMKVTVTAFAVLFLAATGAQAADPVVKCEAGKLKVSSKYAACRLKADAKAVKKGELSADYTNCVAKFTAKWNSLEEKVSPAVCPSDGDQVSMDTRITTDAAEIATLLAGGTISPAPFCGDGVIDAGEECDFGDLDGEDCTSQLGEEAVGALGCASDTCLYDTSGCQARYEEQNVGGEPTVVDHLTGLEWVVTNDTGSGLLDKDNTYTWSAGTNDPDGTAFTVYIAGLNGGSYGGHADWRLPSSGGCCGFGPFAPAELESIVDCSFGSPCIDEALFGDTASSSYWSATTFAANPNFAWVVLFGSGDVDGDGKTIGLHVRAVRGGL